LHRVPRTLYMSFINENRILSEVVEKHCELIPVINRFGIRLGLSDNSIRDICFEHAINPDFFLVIINTFLNDDYFPEKRLQTFSIQQIADYLKQTDMYYMHAMLPNIEKHLNAFIALSSPKNAQLELIRRFFLKFKSELINRIETGGLDDNHTEEMLHDLKQILIKHLAGSFNDNLCYGVIFSISGLEKDIQMHNRIRNKVLKPMIDLLDDPNFNLLSFKDIESREENESELSNREIEVLKLIAQGFINKEIADKLNISLNTVLSHRKNITSKLRIKTVSGLTFYSIANGYISGESIEI